MKSISPIKFLTAVSFLVVSLGSINLMALSQKDCSKYTDPDKKVDCEEYNKTVIQEAQDKADSKCTSAIEKYNTATKEASGACESFDQVPGKNKNTCDARLTACRKTINSGVAQNGSTDDLTKTMMNIYVQKNFPGVNPNDYAAGDGTTAGPSCTNFIPKDARKDKKTEQKDLDTQIKQLKKEIADEKKKINEDNSKLRDKNAETDSELQKVDEAMKKAILSVDKKKGEDLRKLNEDVAKSAVTIRTMNTAIIKRKEESESIKFDYAQKMQQFTEDKINTQCQAALDTAKECFVKSSKGQASSDPKNICAGFSFSGSGATGTAQLKVKLQKVRDACFEQASLTVNKSNFEQSKSLRAIETDITEKTNQVNDANADLTRKQNDFAAINAESDKERTNEETSAQKQIDNLKSKLAQTSKSTQEAILVSNQNMQQLQNELNDLVTKQAAAKMGILQPEELSNTLSDAEGVIKARETARQIAEKSCCTESSNSDTALCSQLKKDSIVAPDTKGRAGVSSKGTSK